MNKWLITGVVALILIVAGVVLGIAIERNANLPDRIDDQQTLVFGSTNLIPGSEAALRVVVRHAGSKNLNRRLIALADLYSNLAVEYADENPPEGLTFDPVQFQELIDAGTRLYEMVANQDGTPEKLEASRRLEAFLAFALAIDNDRFTP